MGGGIPCTNSHPNPLFASSTGGPQRRPSPGVSCQMPTAKELREHARDKREQAASVLRRAPTLLLKVDRDGLLWDAARLHAEASSLEAQADELRRPDG